MLLSKDVCALTEGFYETLHCTGSSIIYVTWECGPSAKIVCYMNSKEKFFGPF